MNSRTGTTHLTRGQEAVTDLGRWIISTIFRLRKGGTPVTAATIATELGVPEATVLGELRTLRLQRVLDARERGGLHVWGPHGNV